MTTLSSVVRKRAYLRKPVLEEYDEVCFELGHDRDPRAPQ